MTIIINEDDAGTIPLVSAVQQDVVRLVMVNTDDEDDDDDFPSVNPAEEDNAEEEELDGSRGKRIQNDGSISDVHKEVVTVATTVATTAEETTTSTAAQGPAEGAESITAAAPPTRVVKFDKVIIREYGRTVGDNPSCSSGPPVSISWEYDILGEFDFEYYESVKPPSRCQQEMVLPRKIRYDMLQREWNIRNQDVATAVRQNVRIKNQRKQTINNLGKGAEHIEIAFESCSRKIKRIINFQKPVSKQADMLLMQHEMAQQHYKMKQLVEEKIAEAAGEECRQNKKKPNLIVKGSGNNKSSVMMSSERSNMSDVTHTMTEWNDISLRSANNNIYVPPAPVTTTTTTATADDDTKTTTTTTTTATTYVAAGSSGVGMSTSTSSISIRNMNQSSTVKDDTDDAAAASTGERRLSSSGKQQQGSSSSRTFLKARKASDRFQTQHQPQSIPAY